jgi:hypothetical protein
MRLGRERLSDSTGLLEVRLWVKKSGMASWEDTGLHCSGPEGVFMFEDIDADGQYGFFTQARDRAGNGSDEPRS